MGRYVGQHGSPAMGMQVSEGGGTLQVDLRSQAHQLVSSHAQLTSCMCLSLVSTIAYGWPHGSLVIVAMASGWWQVGNLAVPPHTWISAVSHSMDKMDIFATGSDGRVYTAAWEPGDIQFRGWSWVASGQSSPGAPVQAVSRSTDKLDVILTGLDGRVWMAAWEPSDGSWSF